ncbi:hypothetical protein [Enterococcus sp.]|uniref:hypothetical protein n=1 Tax=Enterococcus sp. TaxID=35783 RepID=UPI0025BD9C0C|nr:hypothetical protein [Enterococcus sp.]
MKSEKRWTKNILRISMLFVIMLLASCSTKNIKSASIHQIKDGNSYQQNALYVLEKDKIFVYKTYSLNPESGDTFEGLEAQLQEINDQLKEEAPNQKNLSMEDIGAMQKIEVQNGKVVIDKSKKEVTLSGDDFEKTFQMVDSNPKRLIDSQKNEYEFSYEE